jgi:two-component system, LytTR family, response regulator
MSIRALVIDDEPLARQSVRRFLKNHPDIGVIGECGDGQSAVDDIQVQKPNLIFLDVQMPEMDGFEVVSRIGVERMPATIFVTAYDQYALQAFDANALDYLLKPFGKTRFDRALARARERIAGSLDREAAQRILRAMESAATRSRYIDRFPVSENGRIVFVKTGEIQWIEAAGNYARLHAAGRSHDVRETLTSLEAKLDPANFLRIHRSAIVNVQFVKEVQPWFHGYHLVLLEDGRRLRMSRYQREVAERLGLVGRLPKVRSQ